jgi:hypothetical protein
MAALLPHTSLTYKPNGDVLVDDRPSASLDQRHDILVGVEGTVCKADELLAMKKEEGRKVVSGKKVVYFDHRYGEYRSWLASSTPDQLITVSPDV